MPSPRHLNGIPTNAPQSGGCNRPFWPGLADIIYTVI